LSKATAAGAGSFCFRGLIEVTGGWADAYIGLLKADRSRGRPVP